jgi:sulfite exporter TauE/SafE
MSFWGIISAGFLMGIGGSFHCIGMCGPLVVMLHGNPEKSASKIWLLLHHVGRIIVYLFITSLFYQLGKFSGLFTIQQGASLLGGTLFILGWIPSTQKWLTKITHPIRNKIQLQEIQTKWIKHLTWGILNGTLPCGWVYSAIGASLITGKLTDALLFMLLFGIASTPSLLLIAISGQKFWHNIQPKYIQKVRWGMALIGVLFILRGASLGIPYLSPKLDKQKMSCCQTH